MHGLLPFPAPEPGIYLFTGDPECCLVALLASVSLARPTAPAALVDGAEAADPHRLARFGRLLRADPREVLRLVRVRRILTGLEAGRVVVEAVHEAVGGGCGALVLAGAARAALQDGRFGVLGRLLAEVVEASRSLPVVVAEPGSCLGPVRAWVAEVAHAARAVYEVRGRGEDLRICRVVGGKRVLAAVSARAMEALRWATR